MRPLVALVLLAAGCAAHPPARRLAGTLTGGVSLDDLGPWPSHTPGARHRDPGAPYPDRDVQLAAADPGAPYPDRAPEVSEIRPDDPEGVVISRLPATHLEKSVKDGVAVLDVAGAGDADGLRALVGRRDGRGDVAFALAAAAVLGGAPDRDDDELGSIADGPALVALAARRDAAGARTDAPAPGDLLVFDRARADQPASLIAVALSTDSRGVTEMLYLARGVVRRGYVDVAHPSLKRDEAGRVRNSYLRHGKDYPPKGTHYLAGELLAHTIAWRDLR